MLTNNCIIRQHASYYFSLTLAARKLYITNRAKNVISITFLL